MTTLTQIRTILEQPMIDETRAIGHHVVNFFTDDPTSSTPFVSIHYDTWHDMGEPTTITITIQPGDHLNA